MKDHTPQLAGADDRPKEKEKLDSWKEIAGFLGREVRTVQRWEKQEGLPIRRHQHEKLGTVYAYRSELEAWLQQRQPLTAIPVTVTEPTESSAAADPTASRFRRILFPIVASLFIVGASGYLVTRKLVRRGTIPNPAPTVAVLPFQNLTEGAGPDWFSEGLTEEMTVQLERLQPARLRVIGRTTAALLESGKRQIEDAGRDLGVDYVLKGTVRRDDKKVRVTAQLIRLRDQSAIWADAYDREADTAIATQADVGMRIAQAISARLLSGALLGPAVPLTNNAAAMEAYLKGRYAWHKATEDEFRKSLGFFQQARDLDPGFPLAYAGIAEAYVSLANNGIQRPKDCFPDAEAAARQALALNDSVADTHAVVAQIKCYWNWDWAGAEQEFLRALDLAPGLAIAHHSYAHFLSEMGRHDEALAEVKRAQELEPLSAGINSDAGWFYFRARRYDEAIAECRKVLDMEPGFQSSEACILMSMIKQKRLEEARSEALRFLEGHGRTGQMQGLDAPDPAQALRNLDLDSIEMMKKMQQTRYIGSYGFASLYADLGNREMAFKWLETAFQEREQVMVVLNVHPIFDPIRDDPRFVDLVKRVRLPSGGRDRE